MMAVWDVMVQWLSEPSQESYTTPRGWKLLGLAGAGMFAARWVLQAHYRKKTGTAVMPTSFWVVSLVGAGLTTAYFVFGKNDAVGILQNALPASVAFYNLFQDLKHRRSRDLPNGG